jgi:hypothetical protein
MDQNFPNIQKMSGGMKTVLRVLAWIPALKNMGLMLRYRF